MASKIKALQMWCKKMTDGYPHVEVANFTTSWRNGMAFCALIHRFRPDLIDFDSLSPDNVFDNCKMAFELAEKELNIPAFLEASDMVRLKVPDKLSIITYVSQYYNYLHALPQLGGPGVKSKATNKSSTGTKRPPEIDVSQAPTSKKSTTDVAKENSAPLATPQEPMINRCSICQKQVFLLERHMDSGKLYHRSCFRHSELSPTNKVYSRSPFLSPSLNSETPVSHKHPTVDIRSGHGDGNKDESKKDNTSGHSSKVQVDKPSNVKKQEGLGLKHSLAEPDREDSKKSKFQSSDSTTAKAALKERLEGLKSKYTEKDKTSGHNLPLSSKEANKLEKRKAEIISSEKSAEAATKGSKRSMPLIFQKKEEAKPSIGSAQSSSTPSSDAFTRSATNVSGLSAVNKNHFLKSTAKDSDTVSELKNRSMTKKVDNVSAVNHEDNKNLANPIAKPRTLASTVNHESSPQKPVITESHHSKDLTPKPAPRKLFTESSEKKLAPERPKDLAVIPEMPKAKTKTETPESSSPPPLPSTMPPSTTKYTPSLHANTLSSVNHSKLTKTVKADSPTKETFNEMPSSRVLHTDIHKTSEKRWSTPSNLSSAAVLVTPVEKKDEDQVKSGLLSSLAMVRNRTMSTPGSTGHNISTLPSTSTAYNQSDKKIVSAVLTKPDQISSNSTVSSKTKWDNSRFGTESNEVADGRTKPSGHKNFSDKFSVPEGTPKKEASTVPSKSKIIPEAVNTKSLLKHVDISSPSQPNATVNDKMKTSTPSLVGILKGATKKSTDLESKDVVSHVGGSISSTKDSNHSKSQYTDSKVNEINLSNTQADSKIVNVDSLKSDHKPSTDGPMDSSKTKKTLFGIFKKGKESSNVNTSSAKLESNEKGILDSQAQNIGQVPVSRDAQDSQKKEESLKKMREDVAKVELSTIRTKNTPSKSGHTERPKSVNIIDLEKENELSNRYKSLENLDKIKENDFEQVLEAKAKLSKPKPKPEPVRAGHKLDWQVEAEKRMAAIASLEKHSSQQDHEAHTKGDANTAHVSKMEKNEENFKNSQVVTKPDSKEPEFIVGKSRLKSVDDISNLHVNTIEVASNVTDKKPEDAKENEDFRDKLKKLKHVDKDKSEMSVIESNFGVSKASKNDAGVNGAKLKFDVSLHVNNNNSNVTSSAKVTDMEHIIHLNKSHHTSSNGSSNISKIEDFSEVGLSTSNTGVAKLKIDINNSKLISKHDEDKPKTDTVKSQGKSTESELAGKKSPKVKRKITVVGRNKQGAVESPPTSPHLKKIEVGTKFNFDESLRSTLSESTSRLSISDSRTPPPRPPPPEKVKSPGHMSVIELQQQLLDIDSKLTELEIRGRDLESSIRKVNTNDDDLMIEWFSLVQEKNELVRKEADLVYISREQELENEQEQIESQLRYLLSLPDHSKSPVEKKEEEYLITKKIQLVEQRNLIVDSIDEDRLRYEEEDRNIKNVLEDRGLWKDETGMTRALKGKKVARSIFYT